MSSHDAFLLFASCVSLAQCLVSICRGMMIIYSYGSYLHFVQCLNRFRALRGQPLGSIPVGLMLRRMGHESGVLRDGQRCSVESSRARIVATPLNGRYGRRCGRRRGCEARTRTHRPPPGNACARIPSTRVRSAWCRPTRPCTWWEPRRRSASLSSSLRATETSSWTRQVCPV